MKIEEENTMLNKLNFQVEPMMTIPENSEISFQGLEQPIIINENSELLNSTAVFIPEDFQNFNCVFPQYVYYPLSLGIIPSSCAYCQHLNTFNQTMTTIQNVNFSAVPSIDQYCADLPFSDLSTCQYFYNLGIEYSQGFYANANNQKLNYNNRYKKGRRGKKYFKK